MSTDLTAPTNTGNTGGKPPANKPSSSVAASSAGGGFFRLYKPGQGYWTRLGTALGAAGVILFIAWFAFQQSAIFLPDGRGGRFGIAVGVAAVLALFTWWLMNGPRRAQFLIDTDSEMKKVNWSGWGELIGSTRVCVFFMLLTALTLFTFDTQFHAFFFGTGVWHIPFDSHMGQFTGFLLGAVLFAIGIATFRGNRAEPTKRGSWSAILVLMAATAVLTAWFLYTFKHGPTV